MAVRDGDLEKAMRRLELSAAEKRGIKIGKMKAPAQEEEDWHAIGKALVDKQISVEGIQQTVGRIWCGDKGMVVKDAGENKFLFSFNHPMGKKRALEDGPWTAGHSLLVMVPYDRRKALEEVEFTHVPIWIRIFKLPMGMMNKSVAEIIGNDVGEFMDVDVEENGTAAGYYLRVKVRIDIRQPIMRGVTLDTDDELEANLWCPFEYEFLPEFCHCCGIIGHTDRRCSISVPEKERQYGRWLRVLPPKRRFSDDIRRGQYSDRRTPVLHHERSSGDWRKEKEERSRRAGPEKQQQQVGEAGGRALRPSDTTTFSGGMLQEKRDDG